MFAKFQLAQPGVAPREIVCEVRTGAKPGYVWLLHTESGLAWHMPESQIVYID